MTRPIDHLDVPESTLRDRMAALVARQRVDAEVERLSLLLADPPAGHGEDRQPNAWYEQVFDLLACTHPENCPCPPEEATR